MGMARAIAPSPAGDVERPARKACGCARSPSGAPCGCSAAKGSAARSGPGAARGSGRDFSQLPIHAAKATAEPASVSDASGEQDAQQLQQSFPDLPGNPSACVVSSQMPAKIGAIRRTSTGSVTQPFEVHVEWKEDPGDENQSYCAAACGEYHQYVKGYMKSSSNANGSDLKDVGGTVFGGIPLEVDTFHEDGVDRDPKVRYGHRDEKQTADETFTPNRAHGNKYVARDAPGVFIGTYADFDLTFMGKLVDRCNGTETESDPWRVAYAGVIRP